MAKSILPKSKTREFDKQIVLQKLTCIDNDEQRRRRILELETQLRTIILLHIESLPTTDTKFSKLNTSPYVLLFYSLKNSYSHVSQIEKDIIPAKVFSSIETAAGNIIQKYIMPVYGWEVVESEMHSANSVIDIRKKDGQQLKLATLKSGPRCLNDEMSKNIAQDIIENAQFWAKESEVDQLEFVYGALYGTEKKSNKKDWHILRNIKETIGQRFMLELPNGQWKCKFKNQAIVVDVAIKIGLELWDYIGDEFTKYEVAIALIRACIIPTHEIDYPNSFEIKDFSAITDLSDVPEDFNISLLQRSQLQWLFFYLMHFYDVIK